MAKRGSCDAYAWRDSEWKPWAGGPLEPTGGPTPEAWAHSIEQRHDLGFRAAYHRSRGGTAGQIPTAGRVASGKWRHSFEIETTSIDREKQLYSGRYIPDGLGYKQGTEHNWLLGSSISGISLDWNATWNHYVTSWSMRKSKWAIVYGLWKLNPALLTILSSWIWILETALRRTWNHPSKKFCLILIIQPTAIFCW